MRGFLSGDGMTVSRITGVESLRAALLAFPKELASKALD